LQIEDGKEMERRERKYSRRADESENKLKKRRLLRKGGRVKKEHNFVRRFPGFALSSF
jgi:hypothetical protein